MSTPPPPPEVEPSDPPPSPKAKKRRAWRRVLLLSPLFLLTSLVLVIVELPHIVPPEVVREEVVRAVTEATGTPFEIGALDYDVLTGLTLEDVRLGPPEGFTEDTFTADRLHVRYSLLGAWDRRIRVEAVALDNPAFVLETRDGRTNLDTILASLAGDAAAPEDDAPPTGPPGPLLPVDVLLDGLTIGPLAFRLAGEGPTGGVSQVWLQLEGEAGRERIDAELVFETRAGDRPGLDLTVPTPDGAPTTARGDLGLRLDVAVAAKSDYGLGLEVLDVKLQLRPELAVEVEGRALPEVRADLGLAARLAPPRDRLTVSALTLRLADAEVLEASASLEGLKDALREQLGEVAALAIADGIGLRSGRSPSELKLDVPRLELPLTALSPYVAAFEPGAALAGRAGIRDLELTTDPSALLAGQPGALVGKVAFDEARVRLPSAGVRADRLHGDLAIGTDAGEDAASAETLAYTLGGRVALGPLRVPGLRVAGGHVGLEGRLPRLGYPMPGPGRARLEVGVRGLAVPGLSLESTTLVVTVAGDSVLEANRDTLPPVAVDAALAAEGLTAETGTTAPYRVPRATLTFALSPDRLLEPARGQIPVQLDLQVSSVTGPDRLRASRIRLRGQGKIEDPRRAAPGAMDVKLDLTAPSAAYGPYLADAARVRLDVGAADRRVDGRGPLAGQRWPEQIRARLRIEAARLAGRAELEGLDLPVDLDVQARLRPDRGRLVISEATLELGEALRLGANANLPRLFDDPGRMRARLDLSRLELGPLLGRLPSAWKPGLEDAVGAGGLTGELRFAGRLEDLGAVDLRRSPATVELRLGFKDAGLASAAMALDLAGLGGNVDLRLGPDGTTLDGALSASRVVTGADDGRLDLRGARLAQHFGYADGEWGIETRVDVAQIEGATASGSQVAGLSGELLARYPSGGSFEIPKLAVHARQAGVELDASGRLSRGPFGVLVPRLEARGWADFDRLRRLLPSLQSLAGEVYAEVGLDPEDAEHVDLSGALDLSSFGYTDGTTVVEDASGRVPLAQTLRLPAPAFDPIVAASVGSLGDDFEARLDELQRRLQTARGLFSDADVLLVPPRHADHASLRPYRRKRGPDLRAARLVFDRYTLEDVVAEVQWTAGMLRLDHFEAALWDGDLLADMVLQITPDLDLRARARGTVTNLNLDIPYVVAAGKDRSEATDSDEYTTSAILDLSFALKTRTINGSIQITKLSQALVERLFGGLELSGGGALQALGWSERVGVRPIAAKVWIAQNLLNVQFEWRRLWLHVYYDSFLPWMLLFDTALIFARPALIPTLGGLYIIPTVNGAVYRLSLSGFLDPMLERYQPEARLQALTPHVAAPTRP